jgi:hypothetical protein
MLALISLCGERVLLAMADGELHLDAALVSSAVDYCQGPAIPLSHSEQTRAMAAVRAWCDRWEARRRLNLGSAAGASARSCISTRIAEFLLGAPRHEQVRLSSLASRARLTLRSPLGIAAERTLALLATAPLSDARWLRDIASLASRRDLPHEGADATPLVLIVLRRM